MFRKFTEKTIERNFILEIFNILDKLFSEKNVVEICVNLCNCVNVCTCVNNRKSMIVAQLWRMSKLKFTMYHTDNRNHHVLHRHLRATSNMFPELTITMYNTTKTIQFEVPWNLESSLFKIVFHFAFETALQFTISSTKNIPK